MVDIDVELVLHHGGTIVKNDKGIEYVGGELTSMKYAFYIDMLSYPNVMSYVGDLGYRRVGGLYYKKLGGKIIEINDDKDLLGHCTNLVRAEISLYS